MFLRINFLIDTTQPTLKVDERCVNILDNCSNNVDITLKMKQNPKSVFPRRTTLIQRQCPTLKQGWTNITQRRFNLISALNNVVSTLFQRWCGIISTFFQRGLNETNQASEKYGFAERWISFILLNEKIFFTIYKLFNY